MSCNCQATECINVLVSPCDTAVPTGLVAPAAGDYMVLLEFNGTYGQTTLSLDADEAIILPNIVNGNYRHKMEIYKPDGQLLNGTCYTLNVKTVLTAGNGLQPSQSTRTEMATIKVIIVTNPDPTVLFTTRHGNKVRYEYAPGDTLQILDEDGVPYLPGLFIESPVFLAEGVFQDMPYNSTLGTFDNSENNGFQDSGDIDKPTMFTVNYAQPI